MAEQALGQGTVARRRALFGLLDAGGWAWAAVKALFWFTVIIVMLAYIPDRALYATVQPTIDLGLKVQAIAPTVLPDLTPVNFCPAGNGALPCPAPPGSIVPWEPSPVELNLPAARTGATAIPAGLLTLVIGGSDGKAPTDTVYATKVTPDGNMLPWKAVTKLPAARADAAAVFFSGVAYVIGGVGPDGAPTDTVYGGTPDAKTGEITAWAEAADLKLPAPRAGSAVVVTGDGLYLVGGRDANGPVATVWLARLDAKTGKLTAWAPTTAMPDARTNATAVTLGSLMLVYGGESAAGPQATVLRAAISTAKETPGQLVDGWQVDASGRSDLPAVHRGSIGFVANGNLYAVGGEGSSGEVYWTVPSATGDIDGWKHLAATDLGPAHDLRGAAPLVSGSQAFLIGGTESSGLVAGIARANLAPQPPFFQVGLFYVVVPALGIKDEVGQQLSYLSAAGAGTVDFVLLLLVAYAFNHKERTRAFMERLRRRRRGA